MHRWGWAVLALAVVGCQQGQPGGSPFAGFQNTTLPAPATGSYGSAKGGLQSASAAGVGTGVGAASVGGSTVPPGWQSGATPAVGAGASTGAAGGAAVPPSLPPTGAGGGSDAYYPSSSTAAPASFGGLAAQLQGMPVNDAVAGVRPSGSFGAGGSFAAPGTSYGSPVVGYGPNGGAVAPASFDQPVAAPSIPPYTTFGPSMNPAPPTGMGTAAPSAPATGGLRSPGTPPAANVPPSWNGGTSTSQNSAGLQWRAR